MVFKKVNVYRGLTVFAVSTSENGAGDTLSSPPAHGTLGRPHPPGVAAM